MYLASHKGEQVLVHNTIMEQRNRFHMKIKGNFKPKGGIVKRLPKLATGNQQVFLIHTNYVHRRIHCHFVTYKQIDWAVTYCNIQTCLLFLVLLHTFWKKHQRLYLALKA